MTRVFCYAIAIQMSLTTFLMVACNTKADTTSLDTVDSLLDMEADTVGQQFMKGYELYVWKKADTVFYTMLPGTNRLKSSKEIYESAETVNELDEIKTKIDKIEEGQYVSIQPIGVDTMALVSLKEYIFERGVNASIVLRRINEN